MKRKNPTSSIRTGFNYQDIWGLYLCANWLKDPPKFKWIKFETIPDEVQDNEFYLDDIVQCNNKNFYCLYQVKHKQNPETDLWKWEDLIEPQKAKKSLIKKWFESYFKPELEGKIESSSLVTNSSADEEILKCMDDEKIIIEKVKENIPEIYFKLKNQFGNEGKIKKFFDNFQFLFGQPELEELEDITRQILQEELKATKSGVDNLLLQIFKECRQRYPKRLLITTIQEWGEWDKPRPLTEKFEVPSDFVFFDETKHKKILTDLKDPNGGVKVISGKPGTGKSTYLAKLHESLTNNKIISIRHHYYISEKETNPMDRINSNRVIEAIKAQIKQYPKELESLAYKNSQNISTREYLDEISQSLHRQEKTFVFIIDGLDHVLRYGDEAELKDFLKEVVFPQSNLWFVFGTQTIAKQYLPPIVFDKCPEDKWIEIKGITKEGLSKIVDKNIIELNLPDDLRQKKDICNKLFKLTEGNPLHLRYTLKQLKDKLGNRLLTEFELDNLLPYGGDIDQYYKSLWNQIPPSGKTLAILITSAGFSLRKNHLLEVLQGFESFESYPSRITEGFNSIHHLLEEYKTTLFVYHSSFEAFIRSRTEYNEQEKVIKQHLKEWLENSDNEELKWAELRKLCYDLDDPEPILAIDRNWLVDAICYSRPPQKIISQLELGAKAAFEKKLFDKTFELSNLKSYYQDSSKFVEEASEKIWEQAFNRRSPDVSKLNLTTYSLRQLLAIVELAEKQGKPEIIQEIFDIIINRHDSQEDVEKKYIDEHIPLISVCLVRIVSFVRTHESKRVYTYIKQFADEKITNNLFMIYVDTLLRTEQFTKVTELLTLELTKDERQTILDKCAEYDLELQKERFLEIINNERQDILSPFCLLYLVMRSKKIKYVPDLSKREIFPHTVKEYDIDERKENAKIFSNNFYLGIIYTLLGKEDEIKNWENNATDRWALTVMSKLFEASIQIAKQIEKNDSIDYKEVFKKLALAKKLNFPEDRDLYALQFSLKISLSSILKTVRLLKLEKKQSIEINKEDLTTIILSKFYDQPEIIKFLLDLDSPLLSKEAFENFIFDEKYKWRNFVTSFPNRAEHYADLAKLASIHGDKKNQREFICLAANNLLGYGYHKDMYLNGVMESIELCNEANSTKVNEWIKRIAPIVENINSYTDGDGTHYFPIFLARVLLAINPQLLYKYYYHKAKNEELFLAEDIFKFVLRSLQFNKDIDIALATTGLDKNSINELKNIAQSTEGANQALEIIENCFGTIEYHEEDDSSSTLISKKEVEDYSIIVPEKLEKYLATFKTRWDQHGFVISWTRYWLDKKDTDKKEIYQTLMTIINKDGLHNAEGELLDILYPLAYEFDNDKAFNYLCWAQANSNGWDLYWTYERKDKIRWNFIKEHYPERYLEFFEKSIVYSGKRYGRGGSYFIPIPRGIEFLRLFDNLELIEEITESSVKFAESLMADLELPKSLWMTENSNIDIVDILFQRLLWPSPLARERVATGIARTLIYAQDKEQILERLLNWIKNQKLESTIAIGLLPILKAAESKNKAVEYTNLQEVIKALPITSIVIEKLIEELARLLGKEINLAPKRRSITEALLSYHPTEFFEKYIKSFLAPIYFQRALKIKEKTGKDFIRQWAYTSAEMMKECRLEESIGDAINFIGSKYSPILPGMSSILSEVYRSAFLRVLQHFYNLSLIPNETYLKYAYATLPVELSYWKVKPGRSPEWWPELEYSDPKEDKGEEIDKIAYQKSIDEIVCKNKIDKSVIIGIDGAVKPAGGWTSEIINTSVLLVAFGYKVIGLNIPKAEEVAKKIRYSPLIKVILSQTILPFNFLESYTEHISMENPPIKIEDLIIYPLVSRNIDSVINLWQWFRGFHHAPFGLSLELAYNLWIKIENYGWKYVNNKTIVAKSCDWLEGLKERHDKDLEIPHGQYIEINESFLDSYLKKNQLRLGYVTKVVYKYRKYSSEEPKVIEDYQLIDVSKIII